MFYYQLGNFEEIFNLMMVLKVIGPDVQVLQDIASLLIQKRLLAVATVEGPAAYYEAKTKGEEKQNERYVLSGISKSLLFKTINDVLRAKYGTDMPLLYSEPIIMLDPEHTENILTALVKT